MELEEEMEQQVVMLEAKIREEEQRKLDQQKQEANMQLQHAQEELQEMEEKVKSVRNVYLCNYYYIFRTYGVYFMNSFE